MIITEIEGCPSTPFKLSKICTVNTSYNFFVESSTLITKDFFVDVKEIFEAYAPVPAPISKVNGEYRWRVLMKELLTDEKIKKLWIYVEKYLMLKSDIKISIDVNPNNMS